MRFTQLTAHAHGPFTGETLTPAPGFTVVWGLNEAGKSSWHSATQLAITGLRRGKGRASRDEQQLIDQRRPRSGDRWRLEAAMCLDDGDALTVTWDLQNRVARVLDGLGRDRSNEWLSAGATDLSRIVGLDRASFLATACVRQSDLLRVHDDAGLLQDLLQKATSSADADATAAAAIALIDRCRREQVGLERESSSRPLMEARRNVDATSQRLTAAQAAHQERLDLLTDLTETRAELAARREEHEALRAALALSEARERHDRLVRHHAQVDDLVRRSTILTHRLDQLAQQEQLLLAARHHADQVSAAEAARRLVHETAALRGAIEDADRHHEEVSNELAWWEHERAHRSATRSRQRYARAAELHRRHPVAPTRPTQIDEVARLAYVLIDRWAQRPTVPVLDGPSADELTARLASLTHGSAADASGPPGADGTDPAARRHHRTAAGHQAAPLAPIGPAGIVLLGLVLGIAVHPAFHLLVVVGVVAAIALMHRSRPVHDTPSPVLQQRLARVEAAELTGRRDALAARLAHRRGQEAQATEARAVLERLERDLATMAATIGAGPGLTTDRQVDAVSRWLARQAEQRRRLHLAHDEWAELTNLLGGGTLADLEGAAAQDEALLRERAIAVDGLPPDPDDRSVIDDRDLVERVRKLSRAATQASASAERLRRQVSDVDPLLALATARQGVEEAHRRLVEQGGPAAEPLVACSVDDLAARLVACRTSRDQQRRARDEAAGQLRQLESQGANASRSTPGHPRRPTGTPTALLVATEAEVLELEQAFLEQPAHRSVAVTVEALPPVESLRSRIEGVAEQANRLDHLVAGLEGRLLERDTPEAVDHPAVAAENHEAALLELERVRELAEVLDETRSLLVAAEDRVHRDIAPRLNTAINRWLPQIFGDRYRKVLIDPASLDVQVFAAGDSHRADLLSQGTTEQFALLLRVALTETLTQASGESCPLLLDEITVTFDRERKVAVLELLREVATERQVILFTQEDDVRAWAEDNLTGTNSLIELAGRISV